MKTPGMRKNALENELDSGWIAAVQRKDLNAYNRLVTEYQDQAYSFARYVLCNQAAAAQATQQAFALAYHRAKEYRSNSFLSWLLQNLVEVCQGKLASKQAIPMDSDQALRLAIALVDLEGLDYQQAARITGKSPQQISQYVAQARRQLCHSAHL